MTEVLPPLHEGTPPSARTRCRPAYVSGRGAVRELSRRDLLRWSAMGLAAATLAGCGGTTAPSALTGRIDVHQHMIPDAYRRWLAARGVLDVGGIAVPDWSPSAAMASMDRTGTAKALLSVSAPGVTPAANEADAEDIARTVNDVGAELAKDHPDRFGFLATVPLPAVDAAAREATRALDQLRRRRGDPAGPQRGHLPRAARPDRPVRRAGPAARRRPRPPRAAARARGPGHPAPRGGLPARHHTGGLPARPQRGGRRSTRTSGSS